MKKEILSILWTSAVMLASVAAPTFAAAGPVNGPVGTYQPTEWFTNQAQTTLGVAWGGVWGQWGTWFLTFVQSGVNWILWLLWLITIIILIWGGFQMVTAAWDDGKYKKWFTIVKQAVIWLILIWASAMIVNLVFSFMGSNAGTGGGA